MVVLPVVVDSLLTVTPLVGFCNFSMLYCALLCVHSSFAIILMGKRELVALLFVILISRDCCLFFFTMPRFSLQFVIVVFSDHTHLLFLLHVLTDKLFLLLLFWCLADSLNKKLRQIDTFSDAFKGMQNLKKTHSELQKHF